MQASVKEDRQNWIGGSDIPIIMGISPFTSRYDLLLFKAGIIENDFEGNEYTEYGNIMESKIRDYINEKYKTNFIEGKHEDESKKYRCHTDGENEDTILEIKTTSNIYENVNDYKLYLVQLLFYMVNTNRKKGILAVYDRPKDFSEEFNKERLHIYEISVDDYTDLIKEIFDSVELFKLDINKLKENPLLSEEDFIPAEIVNIKNKIIKLEEKLKQFNKINDKEDQLKETLKELMEKHNIKGWETLNGTKITLVKSTPDKEKLKFNEKKFAEEHKKTYKKYLETTIEKGKKSYIRITLGDK